MTSQEYENRGVELRRREALARDAVIAAIHDGLRPEDETFQSFIKLHQRTLAELGQLDHEFVKTCQNY